MKRSLQLIVVLIGALLLKLCYSTASADQLRWILAPTTFLVELVSGTQFQFESRAGYMSSDHTFLIGVSCAGVNFLLTSFLMLSLGKLWRDRSRKVSWKFIPAAALLAYLTTIIANTTRISTALLLRGMSFEINYLTPNQLHRFEGIFIYFGFLLLLYLVSEQLSSSDRLIQPQLFFPLIIYYATMLGIPLANGAFSRGAEFWEYALFVLLTPLFSTLLCAIFVFSVSRWFCSPQSHGDTEEAQRSITSSRVCDGPAGLPLAPASSTSSFLRLRS